jgi:hypothetical protein
MSWGTQLKLNILIASRCRSSCCLNGWLKHPAAHPHRLFVACELRVDFSFLFSLCVNGMPAVTRHVGLVFKTNDTTYIPTFWQPTLRDSYLGTYDTLSSAVYRTGGLLLACRKLPRCFFLIPRVVSEGPGRCGSCVWYSSVSCGDPRYTSDLFLSTQIRTEIRPPRKWPIHQKRCSALWAAHTSSGELCVTSWSSVARIRI